MIWSYIMRRCGAGAVAVVCVSGLIGCGGDGQSGDGLIKSLFPPSPGEVARDAFNVYDPDQRRRSVNLLSNAPWGGEAPYLRTYRLLVDDPDPTVRAACIRALGRHGEPQDVVLITPYLDRNQPDFVRWEATVALQRLHNEVAVDKLLEALRLDEEADVRAAAANAMGQYPQPRVFQTLVGALNDENYGVVHESIASLKLLTGQNFGEDGSAWLDWADEQSNLFAAQQTYYFPQYVKPIGMVDKLQFWKDKSPPDPQQPAGLRLVSTAAGDSTASAVAVAADGKTAIQPATASTSVTNVAPAPTALHRGAIAVLAEVKEPRWAAADPGAVVGSPLPRGFLQLDEGQAVIAFGNGTKVRLYGPVAFEVNSDNRGYLRHGKIAIVHPEGGTAPFMLNTQAMSLVISEGATIGMALAENGTAQVHALQGNAVVSLIDTTSGLVKKTLADDGRSITIDAAGTIRGGRASDEMFPME